MNIHPDWDFIKGLLNTEPLLTLKNEILPNVKYYPAKENIFKVFEMPLSSIKVVILGQDPYFTPNDAIGRAFAVSKVTRIPPSLRNIYTEIISEVTGANGLVDNSQSSEIILNLDKWKTLEHLQEQGAFLLNTALTVEAGIAGSHLKYWESFTKAVIHHISFNNPCVWLLWGAKAKAFLPSINFKSFDASRYDADTINDIPAVNDYNYILTAPHPAAESYSGGKAGFFGCNHFAYTNVILKKKNINPIKW